MENKKICVVIDTQNSKNNIIRVLNSVKRQVAYDDVLIVILYDESKDTGVVQLDEIISAEINEIFTNYKQIKNLNDMKKLLEANSIKRILFINNEIILAPNAISELSNDDMDSEEQLILNHIILDDENYIQNEKIKFSPYCKLYLTDDLYKINEISEFNISQTLQLKYLLLGKELKTVNAYAYQIGNIGIDVDYENGYEYMKLLLENEDVAGIDMVTDIIENTLYKAFKKSIEDEEKQAFALLQKCMTNLAFDKTILKLELNKYEIEPELCNIIGRCNVLQFKKMYEKFTDLNAKEEVHEKMLDENINLQQVAGLQDVINNLELRVNSLEQEQNGYAAAQHIVGMYQNGKLGMGTIIKSAIAWIKYKLSGKR